MSSAELTGRVALLTGATSGIGAATAKLLAERGAHVLVAGRDADRGERVVAGVREHGGKADFLAADLQDADSVRRLAREATALGGGHVDILVNNAGVYPFGPTAETPADQVDSVYDLNVKAPFYLVGELAPAMAERGRGAIVNVSTIAAEYGIAGMALYGSSKAAVNLLTKAWAAEFGPRGCGSTPWSPVPSAPRVRPAWGTTWPPLPHRRPPAGPVRRARSPRRSPTW